MAKSKGRRLAEWLRNLDSNSKASSDTIADDSISTAKLQTDAVTNPKIADGAIHTANLADANVTFAKLHTALVVTESDAISSNDNDTTVPTSAAVIDYVATQIATKDNSDEITEGSTNLYFTNARARAAISENSTQLAYDSSTGILTFTQGNTDTVSEGSTNLYYTDARVASYLSTNGYGTSSSIIASITDSAPTTLDTLNELAAALGDDANFSTTVTNSIGTKWTQDNTKISNWDTAYSWGNHASAGYLTSYTETDTLNSVTGRGATTTNAVGTGKITVTTSQQNGLELDGSHSNGSYLYINGPVGNTWFGQNGSGLAAIWSDGSTQALTLAASTGNATFSGSVTATGATFTGDVSISTTSAVPLLLKDSNATGNSAAIYINYHDQTNTLVGYVGMGSSNNGDNYLYATNGSPHLYSGNSSAPKYNNNTIWHAGNDGSGSGLDADTLDGVQGSSYLRSDTSDTFTGNLTIASGSLTLPAGYNLQWGAGYNSGKSTIWSDGTANIIRMAPTGNSSGKTLELTATATNTFRSLLIDSNWGAGTYSEALTVYGTYPSYAFRSTTSSTTFLQHLDSAGHLTWYFDTTGNTGTSWNMKAKLTSAGVLTIGSSGSDTVWSSGNDGSGSGLDADLLDGIQGSQFLRSDAADSWNSLLTYNGSNNGLEVGGIRGTALGSQTGDFIHLYERVNIGYPSGWGGQAAPSYGLSTHGGAQFNVGAVSGAPFTFNGNNVWHAGNDGSGSGLDADLLDGQQGSYYTDIANSSGQFTMISATSASSRDKIRVYPNSNYAIGMQDNITYGHLGDWAMTFQMNDDTQSDRGFWWGDAGHGLGNGAMSLTTNGRATIATSLSIGQGESITGPNSTTLYVDGNAYINRATYGGLSIGETPTNYDGWNTQLNVNGSSHSRINVKTANVRMGIYAHDSWHGGAMGHVGTYTNHQLSFICNAAQRAVLTTAGSLSTTSQGTLWGASNDGSGSGLDADTLDGIHKSGMWANMDGAVRTNYTLKFRAASGNYAGIQFDSQANTSNYAGFFLHYGGTSTSDVYTADGITLVADKGWLTLAQRSTSSKGVRIMSGTTSSERLKVTTAGDIQFVNGNSFTYGGNTIWHAGNDGSGSGLDADTVDGQQATSLVGTHNGHNRAIQAEVGALHFYADGGNSAQSAHSYAIFQEAGAWSSPYPDLRISYHTGIKFGANASYDGMRFYTDYDYSSRVLQVNGSSNYIYKDVWMHTDGGEGIYSSTNASHIYPNTTGTYGSWAISGSRSSYSGFYDTYSGNNIGMYDSGGNGGAYRTGNRWITYYHVSNACYGIGGSTTSSSYGLYEQMGGIYSTGNITAYSDRRVKENIIQIDSALDKVNKLEGVYYNRIDDKTKTKEIGFIAQDVQEVVPELVTYAEDIDEYGVKYGNATALLVEAVKELTQKVKELEKKLEEK